MAQTAAGDELVFDTKWFQIVARRASAAAEPHFVINATDFVAVVALDADGKLLLVRQFRPAVGRRTLEIPSGHVEAGDTPEETARKELLEETGHVVDRLEFLSTVAPAVGRFSNTMWCYFARDTRPSSDPKDKVEAGVEVVRHGGSLRELLLEKEFCSSLSHTALLAALARGKLSLDS